MLCKFEEVGIILIVEKCEYLKVRLIFFGYVVDVFGICLDFKKIKVLCDIDEFINVIEFRCFLGMISFLIK